MLPTSVVLCSDPLFIISPLMYLCMALSPNPIDLVVVISPNFCVPKYLLPILKSDLKLMEIDNEQLGIPDTPYKCSIKMPSKEFERIVRDLQVLGDTCTISCGKEGVRFTVSGPMGTGNILTRANATAENEKDHVIIDMEEPVELNFALRYLNFFTKATNLSDHVIISMSPEVPVVVEYPIEDFGGVKYYLAPKIEED